LYFRRERILPGLLLAVVSRVEEPDIHLQKVSSLLSLHFKSLCLPFLNIGQNPGIKLKWKTLHTASILIAFIYFSLT
jgi:hypothetical protein